MGSKRSHPEGRNYGGGSCGAIFSLKKVRPQAWTKALGEKDYAEKEAKKKKRNQVNERGGKKSWGARQQGNGSVAMAGNIPKTKENAAPKSKKRNTKDELIRCSREPFGDRE